MKHLESICCNAVPYEVTSIKELKGTCKKCMKPTMFVAHETKIISAIPEVVDPLPETLTGMWDQFVDFSLGRK